MDYDVYRNGEKMREQSVTAAKERLKCMIHYENNILDEETMGYIRRDIGNVITKYVDVEPENIEIKVILKEYKKRELQCLNSTNWEIISSYWSCMWSS